MSKLGVIAGALSAVASAQELRIDSAQFGYANAVYPERYTVVRMNLSSGDKPWSGVLSIRSAHDSTQEAVSAVRFSTTPGVSTPVEIPVLFPMNWSDLEFLAQGESSTIRFNMRQYSGADVPLPPPVMPSVHLPAILTTGDFSARSVLSKQDPLTGGVTDQVALPTKQQATTDAPVVPSDEPEEVHPVIQVAEGGLPVHIEALDQFSAVLIDERSLLAQSRASRETLSRWILNGGKMLVVMGTAGATPIALFPEFEPFFIDGLVIQEESSIAANAALIAVAQGSAEQSPRFIGTSARTFDITSTGRASGWTTQWTSADGRGLLVRGPVGFGIVGFLSVDPKSLVPGSEPGGAVAKRLLWEDAIRVVASRDPSIGRNASSNHSSPIRYWYSATGGPTPSTAQALTACLERLSPVEPLGLGIFAGLIGMMVLLGLMIGPGDLLILKRLGQRHRSWMTACGWIGIASIFAAVLPMIVRDGNHGYSVIMAKDIIQHDDGRCFESSTGLVGIFGGRPDRLPLPPVDSRTMWRGVGTSVSGSSLSRTFEPLFFTSTEIGAAGSRAAILDAGEESPTVRIGQWNFRTLMFNEPARFTTSEIPKAKIRVDDFGVAIELLGLHNPSDVELMFEGTTMTIPLQKQGDLYTGTWDKSASMNQPLSNGTATTTASTRTQNFEAQAFNLQWAEDRADAMHALAHDGGFAILTLSDRANRIESVTDRIGEQGRTSLTTVYRIATRVERITP